MPTRHRGARFLLWSAALGLLLLFLACGTVALLAAQSQSLWMGTNTFQVELGPRTGPVVQGSRLRFGWLSERQSPGSAARPFVAIARHPVTQTWCWHEDKALAVGEVAVRLWECIP
jgi:hypothetical protein